MFLGPPRNNIIIFGESGTGKSSIVNMLVGHDVAEVASSPIGCTFENQCFKATIGDVTYHIYDTAGLNETEKGRVPHWKAIANLYALVRGLDGVSLLIYCMRGRIRDSTRANWDLFNGIICGGQVPIITVVTGVENDEDLGLPQKAMTMRKAFKDLGMTPKEICFVVSIRGRRDEYESLYKDSQTTLGQAITSHAARKPWSTDKDKWFASIYERVHHSVFCVFSKTKTEFAGSMRNLVDNFAQETKMTQQESKKLQQTLLGAEKKYLTWWERRQIEEGN